MYVLTGALLGISVYALFNHLPDEMQAGFIDKALETMAKLRIAARRLCPRGSGVTKQLVSHWTKDNEHWEYWTFSLYDNDVVSPTYGIIFASDNKETDFDDKVQDCLETFMQRDMVTGIPAPFGVGVVNSTDAEVSLVQAQPLLVELAGPSGDFSINETVSLGQVVRAATHKLREELDDIKPEHRRWTFFGAHAVWVTTDEEKCTLGEVMANLNPGAK